MKTGDLVKRFDAGESAILARELESIERVVTETKYPDLMSLDFVPLIPGVDPGAETYTWRKSDIRGSAKVIANRGTDPPRVDVDMAENYVPIRSIANMYDYTVQELRAFQLAKSRGSNIMLDQARAETARKLIARETDAVIAVGESTVTGLTGFVNNSNVNLVTPDFGNWPNASAQQILADMNKAAKNVFTQSKQVFAPDAMLLDPDSYSIVAETPLGANNDRTILKFFLENNPWIKSVMPWWRLTTADAGGTGPRLVCYKRDIQVAGCLVPLLFEAQAPQLHGFRFEIPCEARAGGTVVRQPLGMIYMDGLGA